MQTGQSVPVTAEGDFIDLSEYCRLCLQLPEESQLLDLNLIYDEEEQLSYYDCFTICTQIELLADDELPHNLCKSCGLELQIAYDFRKKVEQSKKLLSQMECKELEAMNVTEEPEEAPKPSTTFAITNDDIELDIHTTDEMPATVEVTTTEEVPVVEEMAIEQLDVTEVDELEEHLDLDEYQCVEELVDEEFSGLDFQGLLKHTSDNTTLKLECNVSIDITKLDSDYSENEAENSKIKELTVRPSTLTPTATRVSGRLPTASAPPFQCEYCDKVCATRMLLASHRHRKHRIKVLTARCEKCGRGFENSKRLEQHQRRPTCHAYPEFECEYCGKRFVGVSNYNVHLRFHKKQYPYVCHICAKRFMMSTHLNNHIKTKHENLRFICEHPGCHKTFQTGHALKNHVYVHADKMPYSCAYCRREYAAKGRLRYHISKSHNIQHTLEECESMLVGEQILVKPKLKPPDTNMDAVEFNEIAEIEDDVS